MPEGHTIHRAARDHAALLRGQRVAALSPQGRFADGAAAIDGQHCTGTGAVGKHLFYHFEHGLSVHIHLGLGGYFTRHAQPVDPPRDVVRLRMEVAAGALDIIGPNTCEILTAEEVAAFPLRYGPDLLADPPDPDRAIARILKSRAPIATLLMDQKVISGIGNIYRAEILWLRRIHPRRRGVDMTEPELRQLWDEMRALLQIGVTHNAIITNVALPQAGEVIAERTNIFAQDTCPRCETPIEKVKHAARTLYFCPGCQV
ncbi:MAG: DNA-formamidopyrimidine glycosylase family protein [Pseudomonadota bacterium]